MSTDSLHKAKKAQKNGMSNQLILVYSAELTGLRVRGMRVKARCPAGKEKSFLFKVEEKEKNTLKIFKGYAPHRHARKLFSNLIKRDRIFGVLIRGLT